MTARSPLLIDCDTGIDDALALLYAAASPEAELRAVTCVPGNASLADVVRNTRSVMALAGRADIPVAAGRDRPLLRPLRTAPETHGPTGLGYARLEPPSDADPMRARVAADVIVETARERPGELTLVTLGPLTNLALAVLREPALPRLVRRLVMMVGTYRSPGNTAPTTEWNASVDPEALAIVLAAWADSASAAGEGAMEPAVALPWALGLDVTERAKMTPGHLERLTLRAGGPDRPVVRFVHDALRFYFEFHSRYDGFFGAFIHDALAVAVALDPALARREALPVEIELAGSRTAGETVADWRRSWGQPATLDVVVEADVEDFFERFVERVGALAATRR